jgi:hypothetical protein
MKKIVLLVLILSIFGLVSVSAETWKEFIDRVKLMEERFGIGVDNGHWSTWGTDKWGALMATTFWLEESYENIYKNAPGLSQYEKDTYRRLWQRTRNQSDEMANLLKLAVTSLSTREIIVDRWDYWKKHLYNGGTIRIN